MDYFQLPYGVRVSNDQPIDGDRYLSGSTEERSLLIASDRAYDGLQVFDSQYKKLYILTDITTSTWDEITFGSSFSNTVTGLTYTQSTGVLSATIGYSIPTDALQLQWNSAYTHSISAHQTIINGTGFVKANGTSLSYDNSTYLTGQTSHADVLVDGDFTSEGIMLREATSGTYSILTNNSSNWNLAYSHSISTHQTIINGTGFVKANGTSLSYDNNTYISGPAGSNGQLQYNNNGILAGTTNNSYTSTGFTFNLVKLRTNYTVDDAVGLYNDINQPIAIFDTRYNYHFAGNQFGVRDINEQGGGAYIQSSILPTNDNIYGIYRNKFLLYDTFYNTMYIGDPLHEPFTAIAPSSSVVWYTTSGLNKTLVIGVDFTLTLTGLTNGLCGDLRLEITTEGTSITSFTSVGFTFYGNGNLSSLVIGVYHLCWVCTSSTTLEWNIARYE